MLSGAQRTLFLPFENSKLAIPPKGGFFLAAGLVEHGLENPLWKEVLVCLQPFRPDYLKLKRAGFYTVPCLETDSLFDGGLLLLGKHGGRNKQWFIELLSRVTPGGRIVVCGDKRLGINSFCKWTRQYITTAGENRFSKNHAVVFWLERPSQLPDTVELCPESNIIDGLFHTAPGLFSHGKIDKGSALLVRHLKDYLGKTVADFGAGWGYLSAECLRCAQNIMKLDLYEADFEALEAARRNLAKSESSAHLSFYWHDLLSEPIRTLYDTIIMNPPFHKGQAADSSLGQNFIIVAAQHLKRSGRLLLVANRQLPYEATLKMLFRSVEILQEANGFKVIKAQK